MQHAVNETFINRAYTLGPFALATSGNDLSFVQLVVSRDNVVEDTIQELSQYRNEDLKRPLKIKFHGEEAEDAGTVHTLN